MRWIQKKNEPQKLTEWRSRYVSDINFGYALMRQSHDVVKEVVENLLQEQGWLCAYTGLRIDGYTDPNNLQHCYCHIEHVKPQDHCTPVETVSYNNIVACYPAPNPLSKTGYGAEQKGNWPTPLEQHLFVSPLDASCETRFVFNLRGEIKARNAEDQAAKTTIEKLALDHKELTAYRKAAIQGVLGTKNNLSLKDARSRLRNLKYRQGTRLEPFCFVLVQALEKHILRLEAIAQTIKNKK